MSLLDGLEEHSKQSNAGLCWQAKPLHSLHSQNKGLRDPTWMLGAGEDCLEEIPGVEAPAGPQMQIKVGIFDG